jgi:hypothetical protein
MDIIRNAVHLVSGDSAGGTLKGAGMRVIADRDMLALGPADLDPVRHARLRNAFWRAEYRIGGWPWLAYSEVRWPRRGRVVVWSSTWLPDRLFFWRAVDRLVRSNVEIWLVEAYDPECAVHGVGSMPLLSFEANLVRAKQMTVGQIGAARGAWGAWVAGQLDEVVRRLQPPLRAAVIESLPRIGRTKLRLSIRDEMLLRPFHSWQRPIDSFRRDLPELLVFGDLAVMTRLRRWTRVGALARRRVSGKSQWTNTEYVLTPTGRRFLDQLLSPDLAPPLFMGGHEIYGPDTWVVDGAGRITRWRRASSRSGAATRSASRARARGRTRQRS